MCQPVARGVSEPCVRASCAWSTGCSVDSLPAPAYPAAGVRPRSCRPHGGRAHLRWASAQLLPSCRRRCTRTRLPPPPPTHTHPTHTRARARCPASLPAPCRLPGRPDGSYAGPALRPRGGQEHLRHRLLPAAQHGAADCAQHARPAHHHGREAGPRRPGALRAGRWVEAVRQLPRRSGRGRADGWAVLLPC